DAIAVGVLEKVQETVGAKRRQFTGRLAKLKRPTHFRQPGELSGKAQVRSIGLAAKETNRAALGNIHEASGRVLVNRGVDVVDPAASQPTQLVAAGNRVPHAASKDQRQAR